MSTNDEFKKFFDKLGDLEKEVDKIIPDLGKQLADDIKKRTRAGYGALTDKYKLPPLSPGYIEQRRHMQLSSETSATKSNLTQTGSMLDSLEFVKTGKNQGMVVPSGVDSNGISNADKADFVTAQGRPFLYATKIEEKRLVDALKKKLTEIIRSLK